MIASANIAVPLDRFAKTRTGITSRGNSQERNEAGQIILLQPRDIADNMVIHNPDRIKASLRDSLDRHFLRQ